MKILLFLLLLLGLILLIGLILPVHLIMEYEEDFVIKIKILFFKFKLFPVVSSKHVNAKEIERKDEGNKVISVGKLIKSRGLFGFLKLAYSIIGFAIKTISRALRHINIKEMVLDINVGSDDAAATSIRYGQVCSGVYSILGLIASIKNPEICKVNISPDFCGNDISFKFNFHIYTRTLFVFDAAIFFLWKYFKSEILKI